MKFWMEQWKDPWGIARQALADVPQLVLRIFYEFHEEQALRGGLRQQYQFVGLEKKLNMTILTAIFIF